MEKIKNGNIEKNYKELCEFSEEINSEIDELISEKNASKIKSGKLKPEHHPKPIKFNESCKYLIININPSFNKNKGEEQFLNKSFITIDEEEYDLNDDDLKVIDGNPQRKHNSNKEKYDLIFQYFHKKPYKLIKELNKNISLFWEEPNEFKKMMGYFDDYFDKRPKTNEVKKVKRILNKIKGKHENSKKDYKNFLVFAEFVYYRCKTQKILKDIIDNDKNRKLKERIKEFLEKQIEYYNPDYIIITNAYVSQFFEKEIMEHKAKSELIRDIKTLVDYNNKKVFLSTMFSSGNIDNYSIKRLQNEIEHTLAKMESKCCKGGIKRK